MEPGSDERYNEMLINMRNGLTRQQIAARYNMKESTVANLKSKIGYTLDSIALERVQRQDRLKVSLPCGILKSAWPRCFGQGCYLNYKCAAFKTPRRRGMQILKTECTNCGHEHDIQNEMIGWQLGDSIMAVCPECENETENWITKIVVVDDIPAAA